MRGIQICIVLLTLYSQLAAQSTSLKKRTLSAIAENTVFQCKTPTSIYTYSSQYNDYLENYKIQDFSSNYNLKFGADFGQRLWHRINSKRKSSSALYVNYNLAWTKNTFRRQKVGTYSGGYIQYFFEGTINDVHIREYLNTNLGLKYSFATAASKIFSFGINLERCRLIATGGSSEYHNELDNKTWTYTGHRRSIFQKNLILRKRLTNYGYTFTRQRLNYFDINFSISVAKFIAKNKQIGIYTKISLPQFIFQKVPPSNSDLYLPSLDASFLIYFNIIHYGVYFSF